MTRNTHDRDRRSTLCTAVVATLLLMATATVVHADWDRRLEAEIPFRFVVENTWLPAGEYAISTSRAHSGAFKIENTDDAVDVEVIFLAFEEEAIDTEGKPDKPRMVFEEVGDERFLAELHMPRHGTQWRLSQARTQQEMLEEGAETEGTTSVDAAESGS